VSYERLLQLEASRAFDATRRFEDLAFYHVAFDELNGDEHTESALRRLVGNHGRVAVVGPSGSGKSSVIASVFGPLSMDLPENIIPLRVPVAAEVDEVVTEPGALARHVVRYVTRWASRERFSEAEQQVFERGVAEVHRRAGGRTTREYHVGLPVWLANAEFARQVQSAGEEFATQASGADAVEHLKEMVSLFESHNLFPVFVFDDSDTWLRIPGLDRSDVATAFFMKNVRMMCKEVDAGLVLAVHTDYLDLDGYKEGTKLLSGQIPIPRLTSALSGVERILHDRLIVAEVPVKIADIVDDAAVANLAEYYETDRTIRDLLRVVQRALQDALSDSHERITSHLIQQAVGELAR